MGSEKIKKNIYTESANLKLSSPSLFKSSKYRSEVKEYDRVGGVAV